MAEKIYKIRKELEERRKKLIKAVIYRQPDEGKLQNHIKFMLNNSLSKSMHSYNIRNVVVLN